MSNLSTYFGGSSAAAGGRTDQYGRVKPWCNPTVTLVSCTCHAACVHPTSCLGGCMSYCNASCVVYKQPKVVPIGGGRFWVFNTTDQQRAHLIAAAFCLSSAGVPCQKTDFCCIHDKYCLSSGCCNVIYDHAAVDDGSGRAYIFWTGSPGCWCGYRVNWSSICWDTTNNNVCVKCAVGSMVTCDTNQSSNNLRHIIPVSYGDCCNVAIVHRGEGSSNCGTIASVTHFRDSCKRSTTCLHCWPQYDCNNVGFLAVGRKGSTIGVLTSECNSTCWKFIEFTKNAANTCSCRTSIFLNCCNNDIGGQFYGVDYIDDASFGIAGGRYEQCFCCQECFFWSKTGYILDAGMGCKSGTYVRTLGSESGIPKSLHPGTPPCLNLFGVNCLYGVCNFGEIVTGFKQGIEATGYVSNPWFNLSAGQQCDNVKYPYRVYYDTTGAWQNTCVLRRYGWDATGVFVCRNSMTGQAMFVDEYHMVAAHCLCGTTNCMCFVLQVACFE